MRFAVVRSIFASQKLWENVGVGALLEVEMSKRWHSVACNTWKSKSKKLRKSEVTFATSARSCVAEYIWKSNIVETYHMFATFFDVQMLEKSAGDCALDVCNRDR